MKKYFNEIKPYLKYIITKLQKSGTWEIHLASNFISFKDTDEEHVMHSKSDNANEVIKEIFESLLSRYQIGLETSMKGSDFIFDLI